MRFSAVLSVFFLGFGAMLVSQNRLVLAQVGGQQGAGQRQPYVQRQPGAGTPNWGGRGGQPPAAGQGTPPTRQWQPPATGQGAPPVRPGRPAPPEAQPVRPAQPPVVQRQQQPTGPLVQPFGEPSPTAAPAAGFGQRVAAPGSLGARNTNVARQQRDTQAEQQAAVQAARNANVVKQTAAYDNILPAVRNNSVFSWFFEYDVDQDAQLTMMEYVNGRGGTWTEEIAYEFTQFLDRNGDGFVTMDEALLSIKEDDQKKAKEAQEQQAAAGPQSRPQPGQPSAAGRRPGPPGAQNVRTPSASPSQGRQPGRGQGDQQSTGERSRRSRGGSQ